MANTSKTHRDVIRRMLNRENDYRVSTYVRAIRKETGRSLSQGNVITTLKHMRAQGTVEFRIFGSKINGSSEAVSARKVVNYDNVMYDSCLA